MANILVIDDEESIRFTFREFLSGEGHDVRTAADFLSAQELLDGGAALPDLIFVDVLLGSRSGVDILEFVRARGLTCPVVVITGEPSVATAADAVRLGAFEYALKPINRASLLQITARALAQKTLSDEKVRVERENASLRVQLEAIFNSVPDAIVTVGQDERILRANQAAEELLGLEASELVGRQCAEVLSPVSGTFCRVIAETLRQGTPVREQQAVCEPPGQGERTVMLNTALLDCDPPCECGGAGVVLVVRDITRLAGLEQQLKERHHFRNMIGKSPKMREIYQLIEYLSNNETTVLLRSESGTGKELLAEALHYSGNRAQKPLVKVNCSALSENLLESELFGHVRGAFTGAVKDKPGRFQMADGGTIFLDEIGDISPRIQLKLLRVIQEKEFERVGDTKTQAVDVRVVTATNRDLRALVRQGVFREDLYYRLKVVELLLPPLRERREDIPLLVEHFIAQFNSQFEKRIEALSEDVQALFMAHDWPGNVRELKHAIEHAFILCQAGRIQREHLPPELRKGESLRPAERVCHLSPGLGKEQIEAALARTDNNKAKAARLLGVSRQTIYRKIREYEIIA